jgi:cytochrome c-type biogenesis protein CcmH/NrfG
LSLPNKEIPINSAVKRVVLIGTVFFLFVLAVFTASWSLGHTISLRADTPELTQLAVDLAPSDPQTHFAAAVIYGKQFDTDSFAAELREYETATALSPNNYLYWLDLGRARERNGERESAEAAYRQALRLAPNYARVQWALGNHLLREDRLEEGFTLMRQAAAGDKKLEEPLVSIAWQLFDGSLSEVKAAIGRSASLNAYLAVRLNIDKRYDEAASVWAEINADARPSVPNDLAKRIAAQFIEGGRFRAAANVLNDIGSGSETQFVPEQLTNGSFEMPFRQSGATPFEWQLPPGLQPQVAVTNGEKYDGANSLVLIFNSSKLEEFRPISQMVAVEPGGRYELTAYYRANLRTRASFLWEVVDPTDNTSIAETGATTAEAKWSQLNVQFTVPPDLDGIVIRLGRRGCDGPVCLV